MDTATQPVTHRARRRDPRRSGRADADRRRRLPPDRSRAEGLACSPAAMARASSAWRCRCRPPVCTWCRSTCNGSARLKLQPRFERVDGGGRPPRRPARLRRAAHARRPVPRSRQEPRTRARVPVRALRSRGIVAATPIATDGSTLARRVPQRRHAARDGASRADAEALLHGHGDRARDVRCRLPTSDRPATCRAKRIGASAPTSAPARNRT